MAGNSKNALLPYSIVTDGDMSASITSTPTNIQYTDNCGYQLSWTGAPVGTFSFEVSQDKITWVPITLSTSITASGSAGVAYADLTQLSAPFIRVKYTRSSGSGTLNALVTAKAV